MDFSEETRTLQRAIEFLNVFMNAPLDKLSKREVRGVVSRLTETVEDIYYIDDLMPLEEFADKFDDRRDREAFLNVLDLLDEAFELLDRILGPDQEPEDLFGLDAAADDDGPKSEEDKAADLYAELIKNMKPGRHAS